MLELYLVWLSGISIGWPIFLFICLLCVAIALLNDAKSNIATAFSGVLLLLSVFALALLTLSPDKSTIQEMIQITRYPDLKSRPVLQPIPTEPK
jgi:hypothetical protein